MSKLSLYLVTVLVWGTTWFAITFQFDAASITASVGYRFVIAGLLLLGWTRLRGQALPAGWRNHLSLFALGLSYAVNYGLVYYVETQLNSGLVAVALSLIVVSNVFLSRVFFGSPVTRGLLLGTACGLAGIALVFWPQLRGVLDGDTSLSALGWCLVAALGASVANMIAVRNQQAGIAVLAGNGVWMLYMGLAMLLLNGLLGFSFQVQWSLPYALSLLYLTLFGSIVAFGCYLTLFARIGATRASYVSLLTPLVALLLATVFEDLQWHAVMLLGVALLLFGQWLMILSKSGASLAAMRRNALISLLRGSQHLRQGLRRCVLHLRTATAR